jgi:hypothetical protein
MKLFKILFISSMALLIFSSAAIARDFGWTRDFNIQAKADPPGFRTRLATRFDLSDLQVIALRNIFASPADAYIMLRFGEMRGGRKKVSKEQAIEAVKKYRNNKDKGWEVLAKSLGVNPEAKEFLALKRGHDLDGGSNRVQVAYSEYDRGNVNYVDNDFGKGRKRNTRLNN